MFDETNKYTEWGHFFFNSSDKIQTASKDVPNKPGVFYFLRLARGGVDIVYIGRSKTSSTIGPDQHNSLQHQLIEFFDGENREAWLKQKVKKEQLDALDIYWFVTIDDNHNDQPDTVEDILL